MHALGNIVIVLRAREETFLKYLHHLVTITNGQNFQVFMIKNQILDEEGVQV